MHRRIGCEKTNARDRMPSVEALYHRWTGRSARMTADGPWWIHQLKDLLRRDGRVDPWGLAADKSRLVADRPQIRAPWGALEDQALVFSPRDVFCGRQSIPLGSVPGSRAFVGQYRAGRSSNGHNPWQSRRGRDADPEHRRIWPLGGLFRCQGRSIVSKMTVLGGSVCAISLDAGGPSPRNTAVGGRLKFLCGSL